MGDCFKHVDGNLYKIMPDDGDDIVLRCIKGLVIGKLFDNQYCVETITCLTDIKLSCFMDDWRIGEFTPVTIEIKEV